MKRTSMIICLICAVVLLSFILSPPAHATPRNVACIGMAGIIAAASASIAGAHQQRQEQESLVDPPRQNSMNDEIIDAEYEDVQPHAVVTCGNERRHIPQGMEDRRPRQQTGEVCPHCT